MKQRIVIAMALVAEPELLLADEPTSALDSKSADHLLGLLDQVHSQGQTILMVTHSPKAASRADRVLFIQDGSLFHQLYRQGLSQDAFYHELIQFLGKMQGGAMNHD